MRTFTAFASLLGIALPLTAIAQPPPPPPPPPSGGTMAPAPAAAEPLMRLEAGLILGSPSGDWENADISPGIGLQFGYTVVPNVSVFGGLRYISVQFDGAPDGFSAAHYDFNVGARYTAPVSPSAKVFGEAHIEYATISFDTPNDSASESDIGFGLRGGAIFAISSGIGIGAALGFSTAEIDGGDDTWVTFEGFASFGF